MVAPATGRRTDDVEHDIVGWRTGPTHGRANSRQARDVWIDFAAIARQLPQDAP